MSHSGVLVGGECHTVGYLWRGGGGGGECHTVTQYGGGEGVSFCAEASFFLSVALRPQKP